MRRRSRARRSFAAASLPPTPGVRCGARITVSAAELDGDNRSSSTNADGRFEVKDLPAGRYNIVVNRSGYLSLRYGQRRPFEQGSLLQLADRQTVENIDFTPPHMSLITGRLYDEAGEAISGVRIHGTT